MNRDLPSGTGDWEVTDARDNPVKPCKIYYVQARKVGDPSIVYNSPFEIKSKLNQVVTFKVNRYESLGVGMWCNNEANNGKCLDYEVRFCCGK